MRVQPKIRFGADLLESLQFAPDKSVVATMELPWKLVSPRLRILPGQTIFVQGMEREYLDRIEKELPRFDVIFGIGGGSCLDFAKYLSWKRNSRLILIPSIVSVDACVTNLVAVREGKRVRNVGDAHAECILVDYTLISAAPKRLNRAGAADILSIHTASFDWKLGHQKDRDPYSESIARRCEDVVVELERNAPEIRSITHEGIRKLIQLFDAENSLCLELGNYRPEEGSEHFFAYAAEHVTGRQFVHGELVSLGILLMSRLQKNRAEWVKDLLDRLGVLYRPADIGLQPNELRDILAALPTYCRDENLPRTIINEQELSLGLIDNLISDL